MTFFRHRVRLRRIRTEYWLIILYFVKSEREKTESVHFNRFGLCKVYNLQSHHVEIYNTYMYKYHLSSFLPFHSQLEFDYYIESLTTWSISMWFEDRIALECKYKTTRKSMKLKRRS